MVYCVYMWRVVGLRRSCRCLANWSRHEYALMREYQNIDGVNSSWTNNMFLCCIQKNLSPLCHAINTIKSYSIAWHYTRIISFLLTLWQQNFEKQELSNFSYSSRKLPFTIFGLNFTVLAHRMRFNGFLSHNSCFHLMYDQLNMIHLWNCIHLIPCEFFNSISELHCVPKKVTPK